MMQAAAKGTPIEWCHRKGKGSIDLLWHDADGPTWDWDNYDYRIKPKQAERQPLGPEDFPPGSCLSSDYGKTWSIIMGINHDAIRLGIDGIIYKFDDLAERDYMLKLKRSLDGGKTWLPCYK